jgi:3-carboxy-cis,cis-muconate cycloisomerase
MRPSSSPSDGPAGGPAGGAAERPAERVVHPEPAGAGRAAGLFDGVLAAGRAGAEVRDEAWLRALIEVEAALARAQARTGRLPVETAEAVAAACAAVRPDPGALGAAATESGNPVVPLVRLLREAVGPAASHAVHAGATSQDILDSAAMLVARRALTAVLADLAAAARAAAALAGTHRDTPVAARTLLQQALPTTFGLVAAGWLTALDEAAGSLAHVRDHRLAVQLGGAAGTLAALGETAIATVAAFAAELGLAEPVLPWHTDRARIAELAGALGLAAGVLGKVAKDVLLYAQTEVGEVGEEGSDGRGGSSAMPHKHNPVAAVAAAASAAQAPGLVSTLLAVMPQEHQRAAGGWHAEWRTLSALLSTVGSAAYWVADCLGRLRVDAGRMRANLDATGGALLAERVAGALRDRGEPSAAAIVRAAVLAADLAVASADVSVVGDMVPDQTARSPRTKGLAEALAAEPRIGGRLSRGEIEALLEPAGYLGAAGTLVDRALAAHEALDPAGRGGVRR